MFLLSERDILQLVAQTLDNLSIIIFANIAYRDGPYRILSWDTSIPFVLLWWRSLLVPGWLFVPILLVCTYTTNLGSVLVFYFLVIRERVIEHIIRERFIFAVPKNYIILMISVLIVFSNGLWNNLFYRFCLSKCAQSLRDKFKIHL